MLFRSLGGRFAPGFPVGRIASLKPDDSRAFLVGEVTPAAQLDRGREVLVLLSMPNPLPAATAFAPVDPAAAGTTPGAVGGAQTPAAGATPTTQAATNGSGAPAANGSANAPANAAPANARGTAPAAAMPVKPPAATSSKPRGPSTTPPAPTQPEARR